jgi:FkbM family methyltransferase
MNFSLLYNPAKLIRRIALGISRKERLKKLNGTAGAKLQQGHIDSLELVELIKQDASIGANPVIFDIGSNIGTWTLLVKSMLPAAEIHAFEPLETHNAVFRQSCAGLQNVYLHNYCAGNSNVSGTINISSYSDSSSLLEATLLEFEHFLISKQGEEQVEIKRLGDMVRSGTLPLPVIIKLDIQGYELEALMGMDELLEAAKYIICEVSFKEYYHGQPQFLDIAGYLIKFNFRIFAFGYNTPVGQELNQIDILFKRSV